MRRQNRRVQAQNRAQGAFMKILATVSLLTLIVVFSLPSAHGSELIEDASYFPSHQRDVLSISVPSDSERDAANKIISRDRDLPRYIFFTNNLKLKSYPAKFCGTENVKDCDTAHYAESILLTSGIGFVVAVVSLIMGVVFWAFRCCCFGGCSASSGCFCPGDEYDQGMGEGYSTKHVWMVKIAVIVTLLCLVPFFVVGHVGNADFTAAKDQFTGTVLDAADKVIGTLKDINATMATLPEIPGVNIDEFEQAITEALNAGNDMLAKGKDVKSTADHYNHLREQVILAGLILPLGVVAATAIAALLNLAPLSLFGSTLGFIVLSYGWIAFSIHYPLSLVSSDVCVTLNDGSLTSFLQPTPGNASYPLNVTTDDVIINSLIQCGLDGDNSNNPFKPLLDVAQSGLTYAYTQACDALDELCTKTFPCPEMDDPNKNCKLMDCPANVPCNSTTITEYTKSTMTDFAMGCMIANVPTCPYTLSDSCPDGSDMIVCDPKSIVFEDCPTSCRLPQARNVTQTAITGLNLLNTFNNILVNDIFPLLDCSFIANTLTGVKDALCVTMVNSLTYISAGEAGISIFMIAGVILSILGIKRFNTSNRSTSEKEEETQY